MDVWWQCENQQLSWESYSMTLCNLRVAEVELGPPNNSSCSDQFGDLVCLGQDIANTYNVRMRVSSASLHPLFAGIPGASI